MFSNDYGIKRSSILNLISKEFYHLSIKYVWWNLSLGSVYGNCRNSYHLHNCDLWPQIVFANKIKTMKAKIERSGASSQQSGWKYVQTLYPHQQSGLIGIIEGSMPNCIATYTGLFPSAKSL